MDWNRIRSFYFVGRAKSITAASEQMCITQSALSKQITSFEQQVGTQLFKRNHRTLEFTPQGEVLFEIAEKMFHQASALSSLLDEDRSKPKGELNIYTSVTLSTMWLPYYTQMFLQEYPDIKLNIYGEDSLFGFKTGREKAVSIIPYMPHQPDYVQHYLMTFTQKFFASPKYLEKYGEPKTLKELDEHRIISHSSGDALQAFGHVNWSLRAGRKQDKPRVPHLKINTGHGLLNMAEQGLGIISFSSEYPALKDSGLVPILTHITGPQVEVFYSYHKQMEGFERILTFKKYLMDAVEK